MTTKHLSVFLFFCILGIQFGDAQNINRKKIDARGNEMLLGKIDKIGLNQGKYAAWFDSGYESYKIDNETIKSIKGELKKHEITVFMGTWCGDSRREVPRFYKILEAANFPMEQLTVVALDYEKDQYKKSPGGEEKGLNIIKVPTFIFYKKGNEMNRIVESPLKTLEKDMKAIVLGENYKPNYSNFPKLPVD